MRALLVVLSLLSGLTAQTAANLRRTWQGIPGIETTAKGRIYISFFSGGPREPSLENTVYLAHSDDGGRNFSAPVPMAGPAGGSRAFDPTLWLDPTRRLWYIFNRGNRDEGVHGVYARICERPDAATPVWTPEFRIGFDGAPFSFRMNKPVVLRTGEWILPVTHAPAKTFAWFARPDQRQGVAISTDKGRSWSLHGSVAAPDFALENMVVQLRDGRLWMLIRAGGGYLWESFSADKGRTWSEGKPSALPSPGSRFYLRRLSSGNLLLVNHYKFKGRSHLTARLSKDDGKSWNEGLLLDERTGVSYPDGVETRDGRIRIVFDRDRMGAGEILLSEFREKDVAAGGTAPAARVIQRLDRAAVSERLLPPDWDPKAAADRVMKGLIRTTGDEVKGAHDADMVLNGGKAYVVQMVNEERPGETAEWPFIYVTLSIVDLKTMRVEKRIPVARGGQQFGNQSLPEGACFVPRIVKRGVGTLRLFWASEAPRQRQSQTYYRDFDLASEQFEPDIHKARLQTAAGTFDMQPVHLYNDAVRSGFSREAKDYGLYMIDSFKVFDGRTYAVVNNYPVGQNAWAALNPELDTFTVLGHFNEPGEWKLTEAAVNRLPDGTWLAICRQDAGSRNYTFASSKDGRNWTANRYLPHVPNGTNSKPFFEKFWGVYYLGWQESTRVNGVSRSVFNIDISTDGVQWERKYRFESAESFQYPGLREHLGTLYLFATQGAKERIQFGRLE